MMALLDGTWIVDYTLDGKPIVQGRSLPLPITQLAPTPIKVQVAQAFRLRSQASAAMRRLAGR